MVVNAMGGVQPKLCVSAAFQPVLWG